MPRKSSRVFVAVATFAVAGAAVLGSGVASAGAIPAVRHFSPAGTYEATVPDANMSSQLVITVGATTPNAGTFEFTDIGDYGDWVFQGHAIAMQIASSVSGHEGTVLIGKVTHEAITGWVGVAGYGQITWSATRATAPPAARARVAGEAAALASQQPPGTAPGTYAAQFPEGPTFSDTLVLTADQRSTRDGTFSLVGLADTGNWVQMGRHVALGISNGEDAGVVMLGTRSAAGFDSATSTGVYIQPTSGVFSWYATKTS